MEKLCLLATTRKAKLKKHQAEGGVKDLRNEQRWRSSWSPLLPRWKNRTGCTCPWAWVGCSPCCIPLRKGSLRQYRRRLEKFCEFRWSSRCRAPTDDRRAIARSLGPRACPWSRSRRWWRRGRFLPIAPPPGPESNNITLARLAAKCNKRTRQTKFNYHQIRLSGKNNGTNYPRHLFFFSKLIACKKWCFTTSDAKINFVKIPTRRPSRLGWN